MSFTEFACSAIYFCRIISLQRITSSKTKFQSHSPVTYFQMSYPLELHLVHFKQEYGENLSNALKVQDKIDILAVLGVFFQLQDEDNPEISHSIDHALSERPMPGRTVQIESFPIERLLPKNLDNFYRYEGSLTTPGCEEIVIWTLFKVNFKSNRILILMESYSSQRKERKHF